MADMTETTPAAPVAPRGGEDPLMSIDEVAKRLHVSKGTVHNLFKKGDLARVEEGDRAVRVFRSDVEAYLVRCTKDMILAAEWDTEAGPPPSDGLMGLMTAPSPEEQRREEERRQAAFDMWKTNALNAVRDYRWPLAAVA